MTGAHDTTKEQGSGTERALDIWAFSIDFCYWVQAGNADASTCTLEIRALALDVEAEVSLNGSCGSRLVHF